MTIESSSIDKPTERNNVITQLIATINANSYIGMYDSFTNDRKPCRGEWVFTGPGMGPLMWRVGYVCQIRLNRGQFGSDMYLIRHADGTLICHENNCYIPMDSDSIEKIKPLFEYLPEDEEKENPDCIYRDTAKVEDAGFLITGSASVPAPNTPFTITVTDPSGSIQSHHKFL